MDRRIHTPMRFVFKAHGIVTLLLATLLLAGCKAPQMVQTEYGKVKGSLDLDQRTIQWLGIPYAQPPLGALRWQAPLAPDPWDTPLQATDYRPACMQLGSMYGPGPDGVSQDLSLQDTFDQPVGSEDCLYLNIQRPLNAKQDLPVIVYLHGGSHIYGAGSLYDGSRLVQDDVIFVSVNYRLGLLGWLHHPALKTAGPNPANSGNFGSLDLLQALTFIQNNIAAFGGDPDNITLMGQSAGASHVFSMMVSPLNNNLFQRAILLSPGLLNQSQDTGLVYATGLLQTLVILNGLAPDPDTSATFLADKDATWIREFLYGQDASTLLNATALVPELRIAPAIFLDGEVQPGDPFAAVASGQFNNVPVMMGITSEEGKLFTQNGMVVDSAALWTLMLTFDAEDPSATPITLEDIVQPTLLPPDRPQQGSCGGEDFIVGGYNDFANRCGALATTDLFQRLQDTALLPLLSSQQQQLYAYQWRWNQQPFPWNIIHGAVHGGDIGFLLGSFDAALFNNGYSSQNRPGREDLSSAMRTSLVQFARTGNPNHDGLGDTWQTWSPLPGAAKRILFDADDQQKQISMQYE